MAQILWIDEAAFADASSDKFVNVQFILIESILASLAILAVMFVVLGWARLLRAKAHIGALLAAISLCTLAVSYPLARILNVQGRIYRDGIDNSGIIGGRHFDADWMFVVMATVLMFCGFVLTVVTLLKQVDVGEARSRALNDSESVLESVFNNLPVGIVIKDERHTIEKVNQTYLQWYGKRTEDVIGKQANRSESFLSRNEIKAVNEYEKDTLRTGRTHTRQIDRVFSNGETHTLRITKFPIYGPSGTVTKIGTVSVDISDQIKAKREVDRALKHAEQSYETKSRFLAAMSHEFRTPLNAILGFSEILSVEPYGPLGDVKYGQYVSNIFSSGQQMLSLVEDILEVAMIENGDVTIDMEYVDICAVMDECLEKFRKMARDKGVEVTVKALGAVPRIKADIRSVRQVYSNVLSNAIKYNKSGGKVNISLYATPSGGTARFLDTGTGISPVDIKGVMKPFVRGDDNPYRTEAGVRLGLSIVKSFIDMQGGELSIESTLHKGTTVIVTFPAEDIELETV